MNKFYNLLALSKFLPHPPPTLSTKKKKEHHTHTHTHTHTHHKQQPPSELQPQKYTTMTNWPQSLSRWTRRRCSSPAWGTFSSPAEWSGRSRGRREACGISPACDSVQTVAPSPSCRDASGWLSNPATNKNIRIKCYTEKQKERP